MRYVLPVVLVGFLATACAPDSPNGDPVRIVGTKAYVLSCGIQDENNNWHWATLDVHPVDPSPLTKSVNTEFEVDFEIVNVGDVECANEANQYTPRDVVIEPSTLYAVDPYSWGLEPGDSVLVRGHFKAVASGADSAQLVTDYNHYVASVPVTVP